MKKNTPFLTGTILLLALVGLLELITLRKTGGTFSYPLDDTFIHMAVARNTVLFSNWGINAHDWVSTSSSPFYTALLALLFRIVGISVYLPCILGVAGGLLALWAMQQELNRTTLTIPHKSMVLALTMFLGALPALSGLGMEHTFQIAFTLFFVHHAADIISGEDTSFRKTGLAALSGAFMVITRYENAFVVMAVCGLLLLQKRLLPAILIGSFSALPVVLFGLYAVSKGGLFIPNSIQLKVRTNWVSVLNGGLAILELTASLSGLVVLTGVLLVRKWLRQKFERSDWILAVFLITSLVHAVFGGFGWFYRYEAYLIVLGSFHLLIRFYRWMESGARRYNPHFLLLTGVALLCTINLPLRSLNSLRNFSRSAYNIYEQQYQMARFLTQYYDHQTVAANDIGAISFMGNLNIIDLWGLGNNEVTRARKGNYYTPGFLQKLVLDKRAGIAVVYDPWFPAELLNKWQKAGTWEVSYSFMLGDTKVNFYAIDPGHLAQLKENLRQFAPQLPKDVKVEYMQ